MPLTIKKAQSVTASHTFEYGGEAVTVDYYPARVSALTPLKVATWQAQLEAAAETGDEAQMRSLATGFFSDLFAGWDVEVDEGGPVVAFDDLDRLMELGPHFLGTALVEVVQAATHAKPNGTATSKPSGAISAPVAAPTSLPTASSQKRTKPRSSRSKSASPRGN